MNRYFLLIPMTICLLMLGASATAVALTPHMRMADGLPELILEEAIPLRFGDWQIDNTMVPVTVSADVQAELNAIYSQTLARAYRNQDGKVMMLSIAYGADQSGDGNQVHRPEFCYTAQGFQLLSNIIGDLTTEYGSLPVRRLLAVQGQRNEPITYWVTVGEKATLPGLQRKINQLTYGLTGTIPDGMLVRVSSIDAETDAAHTLQENFIRDMLIALSTEHRARVAGTFGT